MKRHELEQAVIEEARHVSYFSRSDCGIVARLDDAVDALDMYLIEEERQAEEASIYCTGQDAPPGAGISGDEVSATNSGSNGRHQRPDLTAPNRDDEPDCEECAHMYEPEGNASCSACDRGTNNFTPRETIRPDARSVKRYYLGDKGMMESEHGGYVRTFDYEDMRTERDRLGSEVERLKSELANPTRTGVCETCVEKSVKRCDELEAENKAQAARAEKLEKALRAIDEEIERTRQGPYGCCFCHVVCDEHHDYCPILVARAALEEGGKP